VLDGLSIKMSVKKFNVGDLVLIKSVFDDDIYDPPALIINSYVSYPKIFPFNKSENQLWVEHENISEDWVYDIIHLGNIELAVSGEWLVSWHSMFTQEQ